VAWVVAGLAGGAGRVIESAAESGRLRFLPPPDLKSVLAFISAGLVVLLGSIPQQDVLQRIVSARDERSAASGAILGGLLYFCIALVPVFLVSAAARLAAIVVIVGARGTSTRAGAFAVFPAAAIEMRGAA